MGEVSLARIKKVLVFPAQTVATVALKMDSNFETSQELCLSALVFRPVLSTAVYRGEGGSCLGVLMFFLIHFFYQVPSGLEQ